jgi:uridine phosphorylase
VPLHLRPNTPYAEDALIPGDPGRALALAQQLLVEPKMSNHARGLWGYTGETPNGHGLSIQSTGMGGPSAAIVLHELAELGVKRAIRVGTCGALDPALRLGDVIAVGEALTEDGTSRALGAAGVAQPDAELTARIAVQLSGATDPLRIVTTDVFYDEDPAEAPAQRATDGWVQRGAAAIEMEAATVFTLGERLGIATACLLAVTDTFDDEGGRHRIEDEELADAAARMGAAAAAALAAPRQP